MANSTDKLAKELKKQMTASDERKPKPYDTQAEVLRVEDGVAWVHIPGGVDETPVRLTINAKKGDNVNLHVANGTAWITGNSTNPPTDDSTANYAIDISNEVKKDVTVLNTVVAENIEATNARFTNVEADTAKIHDLTADNLHATVGYIEDLTADSITANDISAASGYIKDLEADNITANDISASSGYIKDLTAGNVTAQNVIADHATVGSLDANYAQIDMANVNNAWIENGAIKKAEVFDENVFDLSGNRATLSRIDASKINVANLRADNLVVRRINGQPVVGGYTLVDSNSSGYSSKNPKALGWYEFVNAEWVKSQDTIVDMTKAYYQEGNEVSLYDQTYIDALENDLQQQIDGAVETYTGTVVPTLVNKPYTDWYDTSVTPIHDERAKHIGDIYYVVNSAADENGYCYRFAYDNTTHAYSWVLIKDSDVTKALSDISELKTFESETTSWIDETDEGLETIRTNHTTLAGVVDKTVKESIQLWYTKANTTAPNKPTAEVTSTSTSGNAWRKVVPAWNTSYPNYYYCWQYKFVDGTFGWSDVVRDIAMGETQGTARDAKNTADAALPASTFTSFESTTFKNVKDTVDEQSTKFTNMTTRLGMNSDGTGANTDIVAKESALETTVNGISTRVGKTETKLAGMYATSSTAAGTAAKVATITPAVTGWELYTGATVTVKFSAANTTSAPTLNLNGTGAKAIKTYSGGNLSEKEYKWSAGTSAVFVYNGTNWLMQNSSTMIERVTSAETNIAQNASDITLTAEKSVYMSKPNLSPFFQNTPFTTSAGYWTGITSTFTPLNDGWAHFSCDNTSGTAAANNYIRMVSCPSVFDGESYTCLVEIRNLVSNAQSNNLYTQQSIVGQFWGSTSTGGFAIANSSMTNGSYYMPMTALGVSEHGTDGTRLMYINWQVPAGARIEADIRISLYEGEYTGEYKPYVGSQMYASQAELKVANDNISSKVSTTDYNGATIASLIEQSADSVKINANHINIQGVITAINDEGTTTIDGDKITTGTLSASAVDASSGTFNTANIPNLNASKITAGDISADRMKVNSISAINSNTGTVKIAASKVAIDGTAIFNAIESDVEGVAQEAIDGIEVGGRNLLIGTSESTELTTAANQSWFNPQPYKLSAYANTAIADTNNTNISISFDYSITGVDTAFNMVASLKSTSSSWNAAVKVAEIPVGSSSGHAFGSRDITDGMRQYAPNNGILISGSGNGNANAKVTISNVKVEFGNKATDWTPAPEDVQAEIDAKKSTWTISSNYSQPYATILGWAKEGYAADINPVTGGVPEGLKVGDTCRVKMQVSNMNNAEVYLVMTVTEKTSSTRLKGTSHGLDTTIIDGGNILTNSITANQIAANAITANKLAIGDFNNYITVNENNEDTLVSGFVIEDGWLYKSVATASNAWLSPVLPRWGNEGDQFRITGKVKTKVAGRVRVLICGRTANGTASGSSVTAYVTTAANTEKEFSGMITISSTVAAQPNMNIAIQFVPPSGTSGYIVGYCKEMRCERIGPYITQINENGIRIHPAATENNSVVINANGMEVFKGGTADEYSVAKYGDTVRIGKDASQHIYIGPGSFSIGKGVNNEKQYMNVFIMDGRTPGGTEITGAYYAFTNMGSSVEPPSDSLFGFMLGYYCEATGFCTKAMGEGIVVHYDHQTAIGKYNENDSANAFEIGWGTANTPKNIFAVDVAGNTTIPDDAEYLGGHSKTNFTPSRGSNYAYYGGCYYEKFGPIVHVHVGINGLTANTANQIYTLPIDYRPPSLIVAHGTGGSWNNLGYVDINTSGVVQVRTEGTGCCADAIFMV